MFDHRLREQRPRNVAHALNAEQKRTQVGQGAEVIRLGCQHFGIGALRVIVPRDIFEATTSREAERNIIGLQREQRIDPIERPFARKGLGADPHRFHVQFIGARGAPGLRVERAGAHEREERLALTREERDQIADHSATTFFREVIATLERAAVDRRSRALADLVV